MKFSQKEWRNKNRKGTAFAVKICPKCGKFSFYKGTCRMCEAGDSRKSWSHRGTGRAK